MGLSQMIFPVFVICLIMPSTLQSEQLQSLQAIAEGSNKFAVDLYGALRSTPGNSVVSPISAQIVLALAYAGAGGSTAEGMAKALHLPSNRSHVLEGHKALLTVLQNRVLKLATKMFIAEDYELKPQFKEISKNYFLSGSERKDFARQPEQARQQINSWVEGITNNKIKNILSEGSISPATRIILVNGIHFKAKWEYQFLSDETSEAPFYITSNETVNIPMMRMTYSDFGDYLNSSTGIKYGKSDYLNAKILQLPYEGNEFSMIIILPYKIDGLPDVESKLSTINVANELSKLNETSVQINLPKFKIESDWSLNEPLKQMGMASAFSSAANFSGITHEPIQIDAVLQKAFIAVDEEGTEAAAATGLMMVESISPPVKEEFLADHPFLYGIISSKAMNIIFWGRFQAASS